MTVGVLGGGQLGRMLGLAGLPLGLQFRFLEPSPNPPAECAGPVLARPYDDLRAIDELAECVDVVTYEFENVSLEVARHLAERVSVYPSPAALELAQDRMVEKDGFRSLGLPTAKYKPVSDPEELHAALDGLGSPAVLKTRRLGYDGKGQSVIRSHEDAATAWETLGDRPLILEEFIPFDRELSIIGVRADGGDTRFYPVVENVHQHGILRQTTAPAPGLTPELQTRAEDLARRVLDALDYVGVIAIELFQHGDRLLANEVAPRVHNSGHWTQDGAAHSQFENHLRAICGLPLADPEPVRATVMVNLIGTAPEPDRVLGLPGAHLHLYGKAPREGRKLGHVNVVGDRPESVAAARELAGLS